MRLDDESGEGRSGESWKSGVFLCVLPRPRPCISTVNCLELYHQIRCRQSSFSLQAMAKVLCALHNVITFSNTFRNQLSIPFDVYLDIQCSIQEVVNDALGWRSPNWHLLNACPPCSYKGCIQGESKLTPERMQAMDGNSLLKRVETMGHTDTHVFESDYFISPSDINRFKDDVKIRPGTIKATTLVNKEDPPPHGFEQTVCTENWIAANTVSTETVKIFEQTGVFVLVCRHGLIQTLVEMRWSGELAKYGLATLNKILDMFGDDQTVRYDITCSHVATVTASSIVDKAKCHRLVLAVNAFHGHAHNLICQLNNHPTYLPGVGIEDLETCKQVFASSNAVARVVRFSSHFH
ncbi:hypothetical protein K439DRAFT_1646075 [Ramaria rubella]|nr:hypothetical protein K439DRAFT_1646075 [Ramaria rubella]